jgi:nitric oxide reductase NorQ protein
VYRVYVRPEVVSNDHGKGRPLAQFVSGGLFCVLAAAEDKMTDDHPLASYRINRKPYYRPIGSEVAIFEAVHADRIPLMLKGPTGCGKTRFIEHMAHRLGKPLVTVACHEDMTASDLVGRFLLDVDGTIWQDGPLTLAVRYGAILYLDEIVEARQDTTVVIHPLTDDRRVLPIEKRNEIISAHPDFHLIVSYNPGYQSAVKDLKESTKQRFAALDFDYPDPETEAEIVAHEAGIAPGLARLVVEIGLRSRNLRGHGLDEGASTRMLIQASRLIGRGIPVREACRIALVVPVTDDTDMRAALTRAIEACIG